MIPQKATVLVVGEGLVQGVGIVLERRNIIRGWFDQGEVAVGEGRSLVRQGSGKKKKRRGGGLVGVYTCC